MTSENSPDGELFRNRLRVFGERKFGTMAAFAGKLEMKPPALQGYLSGRRNPGVELLRKLAILGFDSQAELCSPRGESSLEDQQAKQVLPTLSISSALKILGDLEDVAHQVEATPKQLKEWVNGTSQPTHRQLVLLFNELAVASTALSRILSNLVSSKPALNQELVMPHDIQGTVMSRAG